MSNQDIIDFWEEEIFTAKSPINLLRIFHSLNIQESQPNYFFIDDYSSIQVPNNSQLSFKTQNKSENIDIFLQNDLYSTDNLLPDVDLSHQNISAPQIIRTVPFTEESTETITEGVDGHSEQEKSFPFNNYKKNIIGYQAKKSILLMSKHYRKLIFKKCLAEDINFKQFQKFYKQASKKIKGPESLFEILKINKKNQPEAKIKLVFRQIFNKILRKAYLIYSLKNGKMKSMDSYIRKKNSQLLYFSFELQMLQNQGI